MFNDKLFTQDLMELVNGKSCSLMGDRKLGCAYNPLDVCSESSLGMGDLQRAMPKRLSISFKEGKNGVKITSVTLRTMGMGSVEMNTKEYKSFRSACKAVIDRCYLTSKVVYNDLKRLVVKFGNGETSYSTSKGILTVDNLPIVEGYSVEFSGVDAHINELIAKASNSNGSIVGMGVRKVVREDYYDCESMYQGCIGADNPIRKMSLTVNVNKQDIMLSAYLSYPNILVGYDEGVLLEQFRETLKQV